MLLGVDGGTASAVWPPVSVDRLSAPKAVALAMRSFSAVTRWFHGMVAVVAIWTRDQVHALFLKIDIGNYALLGTFVLAIIGMQLVDQVALVAVEKLRWVRRLLSGQNDIEGDWVDIVVDPADPTRIAYAEYGRIRYCGGSYVNSGDQWTCDGKWVQNWATSGSNYQGRVLEYYYRTGVNMVGGFGVMIFTPNDSLPSDFICRYIDEEIGTVYLCRGQRLGTRMSKVSMADRKAAALKYAAEFDKAGLLDLSLLARKKVGP